MKAVTLLLSLFISLMNYGQTSYPKGIYMDRLELITKTPSADPELRFTPVSMNINLDSTSCFIVRPINNSIKQGHIKRKIALISDGEMLLINGSLLGLEAVYYKVLQEGEHLIFTGAKSYSEAALIGGLVGGIAGAAIASSIAPNVDYVYYYNPLAADLVRVTKKHLKYLLKPYGTLYISYQNELDPKSPEVILKHVLKWNQKVTFEKSH
jgi:hypothetical protein